MRWILIVGLCALGACKRSHENGPTLDDVRDAFGKEWKVDALATQDAARFSAKRCVAGPIEGIDAVICEYASADAVQRGKLSAEAWVGQAVTGVALDNRLTVLGLADRGRVDPNGKLIHRITAAYRALK
jgi:hypothetical protein